MIFIILRILASLIILPIVVILAFFKIFGELLSKTSEYFLDPLDRLAGDLSVMKLAKKLDQENKELKKKLEDLEGEKR